MLWARLPQIRLLRLLPSSCTKGTSLAELLSDQGPNFISNIIWELWKLMRIKKIRTLLYHAQTDGKVKHVHQTIMQLIGKLGEDQKSDWLNHLSEMVQAYNSTRLAVTSFSPYYIIFE